MNRLLILGGSDAGISAALRARELDSTMEITVVLEDAFPNYSICGLPFYLSEEVQDYHQLAHRTQAELADAGISLWLDRRALAIEPEEHRVRVADEGGHVKSLGYDRLIIATGARSRRPRLPGIDLPGVFLLRTMSDSFALERYLRERAPRSAIIVGGGYIGLEMADALTLRGLSVTLVEHGPSTPKTIDPSLGVVVRAELERHGVTVKAETQIQRVEWCQDALWVRGTPRFEACADVVLVAVGVQPRTELAKAAGIALGIQEAIPVARTMETGVPDLLAAGDCVETWHHLLRRPAYLPLGTTAHKQGRIAGENAVGRKALFAGTLGTQVVKVFDLAIARTGLRENEAREAGFDPLTVEGTYWDHKVYYPGAHRIQVRLVGDRTTGRLVGAQMVGAVQAEVAKRIDILATALYHEMTVEALSDLDLSYTPPLGSPWDFIQMCAQDWSKLARQGQTHSHA